MTIVPFNVKDIASITFLLLIVGLGSIQLVQTSTQSNSFSISTLPQSPIKLGKCYMDVGIQPTQPIQMNTVAIKQIVKTIYVEKQTFACKTPSNQAVIVDITLYARLTDDIATQTRVSRALEVVTCINDLNLTVIECTSEQPEQNMLPGEVRCAINKYQRPILMNSESVSNNITQKVASVEVYSRMSTCRDADNTQMLKDVVTFTQITENLNGIIIKKNIESVTCMKAIVNLKVFSCDLQQVL